MTSPRQLLLPVAGFLLWGSAFLMLYGVLSLGCRLGWEEITLGAGISLQRSVLAAIFALHLLLIAGLIVWIGRRRQRLPSQPAASDAAGFLLSVGFYAALAALAATAFNFAAIFWLTSCDTQQAQYRLTPVATCSTSLT